MSWKIMLLFIVTIVIIIISFVVIVVIIIIINYIIPVTVIIVISSMCFSHCHCCVVPLKWPMVHYLLACTSQPVTLHDACAALSLTSFCAAVAWLCCTTLSAEVSVCIWPVCTFLQSAVNLSEAQVHDLLHLRQCFWGKIGQLERSHQQIISRLSSGTAGSPHVSDKLAEVTSLTEQLRANGSEEYRTHMQLASALFRGVRLPVWSLKCCACSNCCSFRSQHEACHASVFHLTRVYARCVAEFYF